MTDARTQLQREGFSDEEVRQILDRAGRMQQHAEEGTDAGILRQSAEEVGIAGEFIDRAIQEMRAERQARAQRRAAAKWVLGAVLVFAVLFLVGAYNTLNAREVAVQEARAQLENVLQRRYDLIPNLVAVTREYATQEREVFATLAQARDRFAGADTLEEKAAVERDVRAALPQLYAVAEDNPQLRSSDVFTRLQDELAGTENRIAVERRRYNTAVAAYNRTARTFPLSVARAVLGFPAEQPYFEVSAEAQQAPRIQ